MPKVVDLFDTTESTGILVEPAKTDEAEVIPRDNVVPLRKTDEDKR